MNNRMIGGATALGRSLQAAADKNVTDKMVEIANNLRAQAETQCMELGLGDKYIPGVLAYATGFACAQNSADPENLVALIGLAQQSVDLTARVRYNDRVDEAALIKGLESK